MANLLESFPHENDSDSLSPPSERTAQSTHLASPLSLARELAARLGRQQDEQSEAWRLASALSLNIIDLLEADRARAAANDSSIVNDGPSATGRDQITR